MAAYTKASAVLQTSASNAGNATTTTSSQALVTYWGGFITAKVTNGSTGPNNPCQLIVQASIDSGSTWKTIRTLTASLGNSIVTPLTYEIPDAVQLVQCLFTGNDTQAVTVEAQITYITQFS